jgi:hypothetical protein
VRRARERERERERERSDFDMLEAQIFFTFKFWTKYFSP